MEYRYVHKRYCKRCGSELPPNASYCRRCGLSVGPGYSPSRGEYKSSFTEKPKKKAGRGLLFATLIVLAAVLAGSLVPLSGRLKGTGNNGDTKETAAVFQTAAPAPLIQAVVPSARPTASVDVSVIPHFKDRFYLNHLEKDLQYDAAALYKGISDFDTEIELQFTSGADDVKILMNAMKYDCPELFQVDYTAQSTMRTVNGKVTSVRLIYSMDKATYDSRLAQCTDLISQLVQETEGFAGGGP